MSGRKKSRSFSDKADPGDLLPDRIYSLDLGATYQEYWDNLAASRDKAYFGVAGLPFGERATEESLDAHGKPVADIIARKLEITPQDDVLEVGVGVGRIAIHIAPICRHFTGVDISPRMIEIARERMKDIKNWSLFAHNRCDLSLFASLSFDKLYFHVVLIHLDREDIFYYLRESYRVLRTGGLAWFHFYNLLHPKGFEEFRAATDFAVEKGDKLRGRVQPCTAPEVRKYIEEAGLSIRQDKSHLELVEQNYDFDVPDADWFFYLIAVAEKPAKPGVKGG
jgi:ubiquinone/menaquinone biosynthesis C-methylase UbiE